MVNKYLKEEGMDTKELGIPFNWIMDLLNTAAKHLKKEEIYDLKIKVQRTKEEIEKKRKEKLPTLDLTGEFAGYPYDESAEWGGGPEPEEPNPYHGTYSEE